MSETHSLQIIELRTALLNGRLSASELVAIRYPYPPYGQRPPRIANERPPIVTGSISERRAVMAQAGAGDKFTRAPIARTSTFHDTPGTVWASVEAAKLATACNGPVKSPYTLKF